MNTDTQKSWEKVTVRQVENGAADRIWRGKVVIEQLLQRLQGLAVLPDKAIESWRRNGYTAQWVTRLLQDRDMICLQG